MVNKVFIKKSLNLGSNIYFVGALSPYHHKDLIEEANKSMSSIVVNRHKIDCYRVRINIWQLDLTAVVYISEKLRKGQIRGIEQGIKKLFAKLEGLKEIIKMPTKKGKKRTEKDLKDKITSLIASYALNNIVGWRIQGLTGDAFELNFWIDKERLNLLKEQWFGRRILITNRHEWRTEEIISAYWGQGKVEYVFKNMKNPFHLALRPQYHWTDQKIEVHGFICVLAFLLFVVAYKRAKERANFNGSPHTLLEKLNAIRLATFIETPQQKTKGKYKAIYCLEEMDKDLYAIADGMGLTRQRLKISIPFSVYN